MSASNKMWLLILISVALVLSCSGQNTAIDYLAAHNAARGPIDGVGLMSWDDSLAAYAQRYADSRAGNCSLVLSGGPFGENLATGWASNNADFITGSDAVNMWVNEGQFYDYASNSCALGKKCDSYTQVVWRTSTSLGCARTPCNTGGWFVICTYNPPGNIVGQRPF